MTRTIASALWLGALILSTAVIGGEALADSIWTTHGDGTQIATIDLATGAGANVGNTGQPDTFAAAFDNTDGTLYTTFNGFSDLGPASPGAAKLGKVDQSTGAVSTIGSLGTQMVALEVDASGQLWGVGYKDRILYQIDKTSGFTTGIGITDIEDVMDLAFDSSGTLYATADNFLYSLNLATGAATLEAFFTGIVSGAEVMAIMFDSSDSFFATAHVENSPLYSLDVVTGVATVTGAPLLDMPHGGDIFISPVSVPEPSSLLLLTLGLLVSAAGRFPRA